MEAYPNVLPIPSMQGYSTTRNYGVWQSPTAAKLRTEKVSHDMPAEFSVQFRMSKGQGRLFYQWITEKLDRCRKPFTMRLRIDGGVVEQVGRFTANGVPQPTNFDGKSVTYNATIQVRKISEVA